MNLLEKVGRMLSRKQREGVEVGSVARRGLNSPLLSYGQTNAMTVATVYRCVKLLGESVAQLPLRHKSRSDGIFVESKDRKLNYLLNVQPDRCLSAFDFWNQAVQRILLDGNAYIIPFYDMHLQLCRLALCGRGTVMHDTVNDTYAVADLNNGISGVYPEDRVIHLKGAAAADGKRGLSVLTFARQCMNIAAAGDVETLSRFVNGGNVRGIVSNGKLTQGFGEYQDEQLRATALSVDERFRGGERIVSLPGQVDFQQLSLSSADMQFLESRKFTVREICRFFGVHPSFVYDDTSNNYKSAEQANVAFLSHTLNPLLRGIEAELNRKLVPEALSFKSMFEFDRSALFACDMDGLMKYRISMLQIGSTVNEVRRLSNLPPVEGGDVALVSANLRGINEYSNNEPTDKQQ